MSGDAVTENLAPLSVGERRELETLRRELNETRRQQAATADVLSAISRSGSDVASVLDDLANSVASLCDADDVSIHRIEAGVFRIAAHCGPIPVPERRVYTTTEKTPAVQCVLDQRPIHIADMQAEDAAYPAGAAVARQTGARTILYIPLLHKDLALGAIVLRRTEVKLFSERQISLSASFAAQAVIAIENARLFEAEQTRTKELQESLEYQTATSEVLGVISRSPNELQPVLDSIVETAQRLCSSDRAQFFKLQAGKYHLAAHKGTNPEFLKFISENPISLETDSGLTTAKAARERSTVHVPDVAADPAYFKGDIPSFGRGRSVLAVPLLRRGEAVGVITVARDMVQPFADRQISLVETFANQAVIALNNVGLFEEVQARTKELQESLEYQTAIADVLNVISRSPHDLQPVFDTIVATAERLCEAEYTLLYKQIGNWYGVAAANNAGADFVKYVREHPPMPGRGSITGRTIIERRPVHIPDCLADPEYLSREHQQVGRFRTMLSVPLLREGAPVGVISLLRAKVRPFSQRQIDLVTTFADQAVIAIENARLFEAEQTRTKELQETLKQQTATADVLKAISRSTFDLQKVLDTLIAAAAELCGAKQGVLRRREGDSYPLAATFGIEPEWRERIAGHVNVPGRGTLVGRVAIEQRTVQIADVFTDPEFLNRETATVVGFKAIIGTPLLRNGEQIGFMSLHKEAAGPFTPKQVELFESFADQAVIAIENARLFQAEKTRTKELQEALEYQTATSNVLSVISRSPSDVKPVFDTIVATSGRLCNSEFAFIFMRKPDGLYHIEAIHPADSVYFEFLRTDPVHATRRTATGRAVLERRTVHIPDVTADPEWMQPEWFKVSSARAYLSVPLLRNGDPIGVITVTNRAQAKPFNSRQIELITTFSDQAVIAIENARLFDEVQARTRELTRSVEELRALGQVGQTVSSSLDPQVVLPRILEHACDMSDTGGSDTGGGAIYVFDKVAAEFHLAAGHNMSEELIATVREHPILLGESLIGQCAERRAAVQFVDLAEAPPHPLIEMHIKSGVRALLAVPLLHQDELIGALIVRRNQPGAFSPEIVRLIEAFAAQSAIAVNNARLFKEIEEKSRQLELASQHKSQFVANMSHELRTPLAAMLGYAELLQEGIYGALPEKAPQVLARIQSNGKHLLGLINTVLDISKIESGQFKLNLVEYALSSMVETVKIATESLAASKKLALKTEVTSGLPHGLGDEQRLTQVLLNLVGNAIKFTDKGEVRVVAGLRDGSFALAVSDTGPGIPPEERDKVFEKFHQIDNSNTKAKGGTGLGLAIAKEIVEMHGGRIWVESTLGHGATFHMELPVRAAAVEGAEKAC